MKQFNKTIPRIILLILIFCKSSLLIKAQQNTDSVRIAIDYILAPLNKSLIPTGILAENSYPLLDLSVYNGQLTADNTLDFAQWRLLYDQALSGAFAAPAGLPDINQLNTDLNTASNNAASNVVSLSLINYASIKPTAITDGLMYASNGQLHDGAIPTAKIIIGAYLTNRLFLASAVNNTAKNGVLNLLFKPALYYTNSGLTVSTIQVDFGNGNGFVTASFNTAINGTYTTIGNKQLTYKITFSDGSIAQCYNTVYVPNLPANNTVSRYSEAPVDANGADIPDVSLTSPTNAHSGVDLFIRRSVSNPGSNTNPQFRKPLLVVEGLDLSSATSLLGNGYNYNNFRDEVLAFQTQFPVSGNTRAFADHLDDVAGYDLIFVNWRNGVDDILRNVVALREVINYVNARKLPNAEQNVVLGISMGGLVARYCLAQMVKSGGTGLTNTQTRLLITHDSPHQGANIPLALQHLLQGLRKQKVKAFLGIYNKRLDEVVPQLLDVNTAINSPAATQQLLARVIDDNGTVANNTFLNSVYRPMVEFAGSGFTPPYRFVATSQGSQCGVPVAAPYSQLASLDAEGKGVILFGLGLWTKGRTYLDMKRLPDFGQTSRILDFNLKLKVKILVFNLLKIAMEIQQNAPGNLPALDGVAGGTRSLGGAVSSNGGVNIPAASGASNWLIFYYAYTYSSPFVAPDFSFVPTTSSLDITNFNAFNIPYSVPQTGLNGSRAANYIAQEQITLPAPTGVTNNTNHTDFYARTCAWLYNEMESNTPLPVNCVDFCGTATIDGPQNLCGSTNATYTIFPQNNVPVTWSANPSGILSLSPSGNSVQVTRTGSGTVTLTATAANNCFTLNRTIAVGNAGISGFYTSSVNTGQIIYTGNGSTNLYTNRNQYISFIFTITNTNGATAVNWSCDNSFGNGNSFGVAFTTSPYCYSGTTKYVYCDVTFACGTVRYTFMISTINIYCRSVVASPNPSNGSFAIAITDGDDAAQRVENIKPSKILSSQGKTIISIIDFNTGNVVRQWEKKEVVSKNYSFGNSGLPKGVYIIQVDRDNTATATKLIVQ